MSKNKLIEIAKILKEMSEERKLNGVPQALMSRYPEGSEGIVINEDKFIVLNSHESGASKETIVNRLKDSNLKYNANFYFSTHLSGEPDIIDEAHNKSKLINEAYTEVSFLPKDIYSQAEFNRDEGRAALRSIIDKGSLNPNDFDDYIVEEPTYKSNAYDEIYRCRCVFHDISGNESVESLLIKAFKVSDENGGDYQYDIVSNENIKEQVETLENKVAEDGSGNMRSVFSKISHAEYIEIENHIKEGISRYYENNSSRFYRLTRVDVKAIYCLRLKKNPIILNLLVEGSTFASLPTYYSMVAGDFNVFICPNCNTASSDIKNYNGIKIHVDHDLTDRDELMIQTLHPIGCTDCMERCARCGRWHFKLKDYNKMTSRGYTPIASRYFLKGYAGKDRKSDNYCTCKENLTWIYDEMGVVARNTRDYKERIVDKFLSGACQLVFINYLTGEIVAEYKDYINFLFKYLSIYLKKEKDVLKKYTELTKKCSTYEEKKLMIHDFVDMYIVNEGNEFGSFALADYIEQSLKDYKNMLADVLNTPVDYIKATSANQTAQCQCCGSFYYAEKNSGGEAYYKPIKNLCCCCDEAFGKNLRLWSRQDDGAIFYKSKRNSECIRTIQSQNGEEIYSKWHQSILLSVVERLTKMN